MGGIWIQIWKSRCRWKFIYYKLLATQLWRLKHLMIWCLQVGDRGSPEGIAGKPIGRFWSLKAGEPGALRAEGRCRPSAVRPTGSEATFLRLLVLFMALDGWDGAHSHWGGTFCLTQSPNLEANLLQKHTHRHTEK